MISPAIKAHADEIRETEIKLFSLNARNAATIMPTDALTKSPVEKNTAGTVIAARTV